MNHPVVHIAYADALAYCDWAGKRLPPEAEFEFASRGGLDRKRYAWGRRVYARRKAHGQHFPGALSISTQVKTDLAPPQALFPANGYGLFDVAGNVWEWTSDWYCPDYYQTLAAANQVAMGS